MPMLNIFDSDPFSVTSLIGAINQIPFRPGKIGRLNLFSERGVPTTQVAFERMGSTLMLVPQSPRGGVPPTQPRDRASLFDVRVGHLALQDAVFADEVQNLRAIGSQTELQTVQNLVNTRLARMTQHLDQTLEWQRVGVVTKGKVLDADGVSEILNLFSLHGVTAQTEVDFDLDNATPGSGALRKKFTQIWRQMEDALEGILFDGIYGFAGKNFMDDLVAHPEYRATYQATDAARLRDRTVGLAIDFGGVTVEEYRGSINGVKFIDDDKAAFFPIGVPDLFQTVYGPADYEETVNTIGLPRYSKQIMDPWGKKREFEAQTNPLNFCSRPRAIQFARRT